MTTQRQLADRQTTPLWLRVFTFAAILLVLLGSTAQASHIHGDWFPNSEAHAAALSPASTALGDDASCPLCMAMHSAITVESGTDEVQLITVSQRSPQVSCVSIASEWHFTLFSRPPPPHAALACSALRARVA